MNSQKIVSQVETAHYYHNILLDRYRYKGTEIFSSVLKNLKRFENFSEWIDKKESCSEICIINHSYGEFALLYALVHKKSTIYVYEPNEEKSNLLTYCCEGIVSNMEIVSNIDFLETDINKYKVFKFGTCEGINNVVNNIEVIRL